VGKTSCAQDVAAQARDVTVNRWTSCPHEAAQKEFRARASSGKSAKSTEFPLADQNCIAMSFLADHGNKAVMVSQNAFVDAVAEPFEQLFEETPVDSGNIDQKVIIEGAWDAMKKTGGLVHDDAAAKDIRGVQWQNAEHKKGRGGFSNNCPVLLEGS
jgi:hypothetical protein